MAAPCADPLLAHPALAPCASDRSRFRSRAPPAGCPRHHPPVTKDDIVILHEQDKDWALVENAITMSQGYVPSSFVAPAASLDSEAWFFGKITRSKAEKLLLNPMRKHGCCKLLFFAFLHFFLFWGVPIAPSPTTSLHPPQLHIRPQTPAVGPTAHPSEPHRQFRQPCVGRDVASMLP